MAVHHFDLWRFLLESEVDEVFASTRSGEWDDETVTVSARLANGALATSLVSQCTSSTMRSRFMGSVGVCGLTVISSTASTHSHLEPAWRHSISRSENCSDSYRDAQRSDGTPPEAEIMSRRIDPNG